MNIVQEDLDFIPSTWTTTSLFPDTSATHNLPLIFPFRTNPNLFSNCESNKKNFQQKKLSSPTSLTSLFLSPSSCRSRGRSARTSDDQRHDRATSGRPARCRCLQWADQNLSTNSAKLSHRVMKREILCLYCLLFMILMIVECFSRIKRQVLKLLGHLYGNENSYLNLNHHFGGKWHDWNSQWEFEGVGTKHVCLDPCKVEVSDLEGVSLQFHSRRCNLGVPLSLFQPACPHGSFSWKVALSPQTSVCIEKLGDLKNTVVSYTKMQLHHFLRDFGVLQFYRFVSARHGSCV